MAPREGLSEEAAWDWRPGSSQGAALWKSGSRVWGELSRPRAQQVQRPRGRDELDELEEQRKGQCDMI